jgi:hypothetical protein
MRRGIVDVWSILFFAALLIVFMTLACYSVETETPAVLMPAWVGPTGYNRVGLADGEGDGENTDVAAGTRCVIVGRPDGNKVTIRIGDRRYVVQDMYVVTDPGSEGEGVKR